MPEDYEVGYGKPPKDSRFRKGESGNKKGRPKRILTSDALLIEELLNEPVFVSENGKRIKIPLRNQIDRMLLHKSGKADARAGRIFERYRKFVQTFGGKERPLTVVIRRFS